MLHFRNPILNVAKVVDTSSQTTINEKKIILGKVPLLHFDFENHNFRITSKSIRAKDFFKIFSFSFWKNCLYIFEKCFLYRNRHETGLLENGNRPVKNFKIFKKMRYENRSYFPNRLTETFQAET